MIQISVPTSDCVLHCSRRVGELADLLVVQLQRHVVVTPKVLGQLVRRSVPDL